MKKLTKKIFEYIIKIFKPHLSKKNSFKLFFYKIFYLIFNKLIESPIVMNFENFKMYAYNYKKDLSKFMLKNLVVWDGDVVERINTIFKNKKSLFIDCGCSFGSYSIPIAKLNTSNAKVIAIDASSNAIKRIKENIDLNGIRNILVYNVGLDKEEGYLKFNDDLNLLPNSGAFRFDNIGKETKVITLDAILETQPLSNYDIIFVKMDLEGYEFQALQGFKKNIIKHKPAILFEFSRMLVSNKLFYKSAFNLFLEEISYEIKDYNNNIYTIDQLIEKLENKDKKLEVLGDFLLMYKTT
jgi:FkbM family methyltransferase